MLVGIQEAKKEVYFYRPDCRLWRCPYCAEKNRKRWMARAIIGTETLIDAGHRINFVTVTSHSDIRDYKQGLSIWRSTWPKLRAKMLRDGEKPEYMVVPEKHKDGAFHAHLLITGERGSRWWKDNCAKRGMGYMAEEEAIRSKYKSGFYIGKYISKQLQSGEAPKKMRRITTSHGWPKLDGMYAMPEIDWRVLQKHESLQDVVAYYARKSYTVSSLGDEFDKGSFTFRL